MLAELIGGEHLERERVGVSRHGRGDVAELEEPRAGDVPGVILSFFADVKEDELRILELCREPVARDNEIAAREPAGLRQGASGDRTRERDREWRTSDERAERSRHGEIPRGWSFGGRRSAG